MIYVQWSVEGSVLGLKTLKQCEWHSVAGRICDLATSDNFIWSSEVKTFASTDSEYVVYDINFRLLNKL